MKMKPFHLLVIAVIICAEKVYSENYNCVWYGECGFTEDDKVRNCLSNDSAQHINDEEAEKLLRDKCPHFFHETDKPKTCCSSAQIKTMAKSMGMAEGIIGRCGTCLRNLFRSICDFTCASDHRRFMGATEIRTNDTSRIDYVESVEIYLSEVYANETYDSCKSIINPSTGMSAMDFVCNGAKSCTPKRWFDYMGDSVNNVFVPFFMKYVFDAKDLKTQNITGPLNPPTKKCSEPYDNSSIACSCVDCPQVCKAIDLPMADEPYEIFGWNAYGIIAGLTILGLSTIFTIGLICFDTGKKEDVDDLEISSSESETSMAKFKRPSSYGERLRQNLESCFVVLGTFFAKHPVSTMAIISDFVILLSFGIVYLSITSNPIEIWSAPLSRARVEKDYFDEHFQPFYRTEQIYIKSVNLDKFRYNLTSGDELEFGPVFREEFMLAVLDLQNKITQLGEEENEGLEKICYAPVKNDFSGPMTLSYCTIQSIWGYFKNDADEFNEDYLQVLYECLENPYNVACLAPYKGPIIPAIAVGGFLRDDKLKYNASDYIKSTGLVLTFLVKSPRDKETLDVALRWEKRFIDFMKNWDENDRPEFMDVAYSTERSIEDELERTSKAEVNTMIISYALMFLYIALALGEFESFCHCFVSSRFVLSIGGIIIVLSSVSSAVGVFGYLGVPTSLLTIEVIPFLVLAVGVDNIFILVRAHQRYPRKVEESIPEHIGRVMGLIGPSLLLSSASECFCFSIGAMSDMPAVKTFAMFAAVSIFINFILQTTAFVSLLSLDTTRQENNRLDCCCCISTDKRAKNNSGRGFVNLFFEKLYVPFLMKKTVRYIVLVIFITLVTISAVFIPAIEIGLDQQLAMPDDSYVYKYFQYMQDLLSMGPPVYFVVKQGLNYSDLKVQNAISGVSGSNDDSLYMQIFSAANRSSDTYISQPASSWIDDYYDWSTIKGCCKYFPKNESFCPHDSDSDECENCVINHDKHYTLRPDTLSFRKYLPYFVMDVPDENCAKAGRAAYLDALNYYLNDYGLTDVGDSYFMTFHTPLKKSSDWYEAIRSARLIADGIADMINKHNFSDKVVEVFPYSIFYVFYEQYLTIEMTTAVSLALSLAAIFIVTFLLTGFSLISAILVLLTVTIIIVNLGGLMVWWQISLNGVSLVNIVMAAGISVEFCSHIVHAYLTSNRLSREGKAAEAVSSIGSSVFSGITITKLVGISVLAFAKTQIFTVFYFRMYLCIVLLGAIHGLIFLPVILTFVGKL